MEVDSVAATKAKPATQQNGVLKNDAPPEEEDLYLKMKELQNKLEMIEIQEEYIKTELNHLKSEEARSKDEVSTIERFEFD